MVLFFLTTEMYAEGVIKQNGWGVEFNPFRVLILGSEWKSLSGTISHFDNESGIEIAIPFFYSKEKDISYNRNHEDTEIASTIDIHYRKYFSKTRTDGGYLGIFSRYTYLDGKVWGSGKYATVEKLGLGGEVGYRVKNIFDTPFYWGVSMSLGGYIGKDNDIFNSSGMPLAIDDNQFILDVELLKVGYEF